MKFLEKSLEQIIYEDPFYCFENGLDLLEIDGQIHRQLCLKPHGIADLVVFHYIGPDAPGGDILSVQIIECKRDVVNAATFAQAARYKLALSRILGSRQPGISIIYSILLIGRRVDWSGELDYMCANEFPCNVYTYDYKADGIAFKSEYNGVTRGISEASHKKVMSIVEGLRK